MPPEPKPDPEQVRRRAAELLPEEQVAGVADPEALAQAVLEDSAARTEHRDVEAGVERRRSEDTVDTVEDKGN